MKIAYVYDNIYPYSIGGAEKRIWELATRLAQRGHEVHIFGPKFWAGEGTFKKEGVCLHGVCSPPKQRFVEGRRSITWPIYFAARLLPALLKEKFDIIDCQNFPYFPCFSAKLCSVAKRIPLIITWLEVWGDYWFEYLGKRGVFGKLVEKMTMSLSTNMIAISETTKSRLVSLGASTRNITAIPVGIDFEGIGEIDPSDQVSDIIFAGRLIRDKNVDILVKSVSVIKERYPGINALIIGDGPERVALEKLTNSMGLEGNIRFIGFLENHDSVISYLKSSKVFVFPSTREGFGIVVVEANACGLPVIVIDHPRNAASDSVRDGQNGFICQLSAGNIAEKTLAVLAEQGSDIRARCIEHSKEYAWPKIVDSIEGIYASLIKIGGG